MAAPTRFSPGSLGSFLLANGATHEFEDVQPPPRVKSLIFYLRTTGGGDFEVRRGSVDFGVQRAVPLVTVPQPPPSDELLVKIDAAPLGLYRCFFTNTSGVNAQISLEVTWEV